MQEKIYPSNDRNTDVVWSTENSWAKHIPQTQHSGTPSRDAKQAGNLMANFRPPIPKSNPKPFIPRPKPPNLRPGLIFVFSEYYHSNIDKFPFHITFPYDSNPPRLQLLEDIIKPALVFNKKLTLSSLRKDGDISKLDPWEIKFFNWLTTQKLETSFKRFCGYFTAPSPPRGNVNQVIIAEPRFVPSGDYSKREICLPVLFSDYNLDTFMLPSKIEYLTGTINSDKLDDKHDYTQELLRFPGISKHFGIARVPIADSNLLTWNVDLEAKSLNQQRTYVFNYQERFISVYFEHCFPEITNDDYEDPFMILVDTVEDTGTMNFNYVYGLHLPARQESQICVIENHLSVFAGMRGRLINNNNQTILFIPTQRVYPASTGSINTDSETVQVTVLGTTKDVPISYISNAVEDKGGEIYISHDWTLAFSPSKNLLTI